MTTYIESTQLPDGTYDHTEVREAETNGNRIEWNSWGDHWVVSTEPLWRKKTKYRAQVPDTYGIHESSSTLREVNGDAGPAVAEMLLDRIKELEEALQSYVKAYDENPHLGPRGSQVDQAFTKARAALNKE